MRITKSLISGDSTIRKSLYDSVLRHIMSMVEFPSNTPIVYDQELFNIAQPGSTIGEKETTIVGSARRVVVGVEEMRNEHSRTANHIAGHLEDYLFKDDRYGVYVSQLMAAYDTTLTIDFRSPHKSELTNLANRFNYRNDVGTSTMMTGGEFFYYVPREVLYPIIDVHNLAMDRDPELPSLDKYLLGNLSEWVTVIKDQSNEQGQFAARLQVSGIQLIFDVSEVKPVKNENFHQVEIRVSFTNERPTHLQTDFPLYVCGLAMPIEYHPQVDSPWVVERTGFKNKLISDADENLKNLTYTYPWLYTGEFIGGVGLNFIQIFASDVDLYGQIGEFKLLSLSELPIEFTDKALAYIKDEQKKDPTLKNSAIRVGLYVSGTRVDYRSVWCDEDLVFYSDVPIEIHKRYQISIELRCQFAVEDKKAIDSFKNHPEFLYDYFSALYPKHIDNKQYFPVNWDKLLDRNNVPVEVLDTVAEVTRTTPQKSTGIKTIHENTIITSSRG